jgi:hypothetical protein
LIMIKGFHLYVVNPSQGCFLMVGYIPATGIAKHDTGDGFKRA